MIVIGIDPGATKSGWVVYEDGKILSSGHDDNTRVAAIIEDWGNTPLAIEVIRGYGQVAGNDTYDTCIWIGRFDPDCKAKLISRKEIKNNLCGNTTTNDKYVRQALIDRLGEVGTKKTPGPLYGISGHCWAALAVAVTAADQMAGMARG